MSTNQHFTDKSGSPVPHVTWPIRAGDEWQTLDSDALFAGRKVVLFSLPGAFTPTCSSTHLPRYNQLAKTFKDAGVDEICCVSVNDTFVMNSWLADQEADNITFIPDGNGEFTDKMGLLVDKSAIGFGKRSWRYSMLVNDGIIEKMFIEPDLPGDPFEVSDADTMLAYVDANASAPEDISLFTKPGCQFCHIAKTALDDAGLQYEEITMGKGASLTSLKAITGHETVPQVFIGGKYIGDSEALVSYLKG